MAYREAHQGYERIHVRLQDWGSWVVSKLDGLGWNTKFGDREQVGVYQKRNDMHADPVLMEVINHFRSGDVRSLETHSVYREMPLCWRNALVIRYVLSPHETRDKIARELGIDRNAVVPTLRLIYGEMDRLLSERFAMRSAHKETA